MRYTIPEILELVEKEDDRDVKIAVLRRNDSPVFRQLLQLAYHPDAKMNLPSGVPPFKHDPDLPYGYSETNLYQEARRLYIFTQKNNNLSKLKIESLFIGILEGIHPKEAIFLCAVKDKDLTRLYPSIDYDLVFSAFPGILPKQETPVKKEVETKETPLVSSNEPSTDGEPQKRRGRPKGSKNKINGQTSTPDFN